MKFFKIAHKEELELLNDPLYYYKQVAYISLILGTLLIFPFMFRELFLNSKSFIFFYYGDYNVQQIPFYRHCVEMVRSGNLGWDWNTDLGSNFIGSYSYYMLGSPFFWILCLFPSAWTPYLMGPMYVIKYVAAAVIAFAYLKRFVKNKNYAVIGSLLYAFCGFQVYNVFFNQFQEVVALFPLLLIGMEELVQNNRRGVFAIAVALNAMCNYFMFYGQVVFCILYFFVRCLQKSFRINLKSFLLLAFEAVLGVFLGSVLFIPACLGWWTTTGWIIPFPPQKVCWFILTTAKPTLKDTGISFSPISSRRTYHQGLISFTATAHAGRQTPPGFPYSVLPEPLPI